MTHPTQKPVCFLPPHALLPRELQPTAQTWHEFITQASTMEAWQVSSMVLHAIARETNARTIYSDVWTDYQSNHDGSLLCYGLCHVLEELVETVDAWQYVLKHLQEWFPLQENESLQQRLAASQQDFLRVSQLNLVIQHEIQEVANTHHVLLRIGVLEQNCGKEGNNHE